MCIVCHGLFNDKADPEYGKEIILPCDKNHKYHKMCYARTWVSETQQGLPHKCIRCQVSLLKLINKQRLNAIERDIQPLINEIYQEQGRAAPQAQMGANRLNFGDRRHWLLPPPPETPYEKQIRINAHYRAEEIEERDFIDKHKYEREYQEDLPALTKQHMDMWKRAHPLYLSPEDQAEHQAELNRREALFCRRNQTQCSMMGGRKTRNKRKSKSTRRRKRR